MEPVPLSNIFPTTTVPDKVEGYELDENARVVIKIRPNQCDTIMMLPCFAFIGCIFGVSADVCFDDADQSVTLSNYPGYCCILPFKCTKRIEYVDIANVCVVYSGISENHSGLYDPVLITKDRKVWRIGARGRMGEVEREVSRLHKFLYGRHNASSYRKPLVGELILDPGLHSYWECCGYYCF